VPDTGLLETAKQKVTDLHSLARVTGHRFSSFYSLVSLRGLGVAFSIPRSRQRIAVEDVRERRLPLPRLMDTELTCRGQS
jgi:hypothetical protein